MTDESSPAPGVQKLFFQHAAALRGFVFGLLADREAADDVLQELFLSVTQSADRFDPAKGGFLTWARGIARNKVLEHFRKRSHLPKFFDDDLLESLAESAGGQDGVWQERRTVLAGCVRQLAPRARQILEMRYAETPAAPPEIAERLAWTVNAVNVALSRARRFLQDCSRRRLATGEG